MRRDPGDQEFLAYIIAPRKWIVYLRDRAFTFRTDHEPIRYLQTKIRLSGRNHRWLDTLQELFYRAEQSPGRLHTVPDALSRQPDQWNETVSFKHMQMRDPGIINQIREEYQSDEWA